MKFKPIECVLKDGRRVIVREAVRKDAQALIQTISSYIMQSEFLISTIEEFNPTLQQQENWISLLSENQNCILLVAEHKGRIIGNVDLKGENRKKIYHNALLGIGILKNWQQLGLGSMLLQAVIDWARQNSSLENLWLNVFEEHSKAIELYEKKGFKKIGCQPNYVQNKDGKYLNNILMYLSVK